MALLEYWAKALETPTTVTYRFGATPETMTQSVVIDKATEKTMGVLMGQAAMVAYLAKRDRGPTGEWPEKGVMAS
jgi:hypothetical protein